MFRCVVAAAIAAGVISTALVGSAQARITEIKIDTVEPFAEGQPFGEVGSYERLRGIAKGELDPQSPQNQPIVDLDKAPRNARGFVEYETDFFILRPLDPSRGNGIIFYEVNNRGRKALLARIDEAPPNNNDPRTLLDAGLGFSLGRGYTIVWSGWDPDAPKANGGIAARFPFAADDGKPIVRRIREEFQFGTRSNASPELARLNYPAATLDKSMARLTMRARESDARTEIPSGGWDSRTAGRSDSCPPAGSSSRSRSMNCGTTPRRRRWWAWALPPPATSSRSCATSAPIPKARPIQRWAAVENPPGRATRSCSASPRAAVSCATSSNSA